MPWGSRVSRIFHWGLVYLEEAGVCYGSRDKRVPAPDDRGGTGADDLPVCGVSPVGQRERRRSLIEPEGSALPARIGIDDIRCDDLAEGSGGLFYQMCGARDADAL